jgi:methylmalonyl-CoA epimerase
MKKLNHVGIVANDFEKAVEKFKGLGFVCDEIKEDKQLGVQGAFFTIGDTSLEIISLTKSPESDGAMMRVVRAQKGVINHLCFEVENLGASIQHYEKQGAKLVEGCPMPGAHGSIAFFYPDTTEGVLIELCEV